MVDPLILLIPLILLAVVLLFVFVGCGLPTATGGQKPEPPFDTPVTLHVHGYHVAAGVATIDVTFVAVVGGEDEPRTTQHQLTHDEIAPDISVDMQEAFIDDPNLVRLVEGGMVGCTCLITYENGDTEKEIAAHEKVHDEPLAVFSLTRAPEGFDFFFL